MRAIVEQMGDGWWRVLIESAAGRHVIGPRLIKANPEKAPELDSEFGTEMEAKQRAEDWNRYFVSLLDQKKSRKR